MCKVAIITDTHFGARGDSQNFLDYFSKFYSDVFWPYIEEHQITEILHLGDLVDKKKGINFNSFKVMRESFLDKITKEKRCSMTIIPGNHDSYYKDTISINAVNQILEGTDKVTVINEPSERWFGGHSILLLPWICQENYDTSMRMIQDSTSKICMGHLELNGFKMNKVRVCDHGLSPGLFTKFKRTFSGHFHHKSNQGNIHYLGAPYEIDWNDWNDARGFHIYDMDTDELTFVQNPFRIHEKLEYYDNQDLSSFHFSFYKDKYVRLLVREKSDPLRFSLFVENLEAAGAFNVQIIEDKYQFDNETNEPVNVTELEDTLTIVNRYIQENDIPVDKVSLSSLVETLYKEAMAIKA